MDRPGTGALGSESMFPRYDTPPDSRPRDSVCFQRAPRLGGLRNDVAPVVQLRQHVVIGIADHGIMWRTAAPSCICGGCVDPDSLVDVQKLPSELQPCRVCHQVTGVQAPQPRLVIHTSIRGCNLRSDVELFECYCGKVSLAIKSFLGKRPVTHVLTCSAVQAYPSGTVFVQICALQNSEQQMVNSSSH